ncbi:uncharacterized protein LOC144056879 [Vanacampus margaritifer]
MKTDRLLLLPDIDMSAILTQEKALGNGWTKCTVCTPSMNALTLIGTDSIIKIQLGMQRALTNVSEEAMRRRKNRSKRRRRCLEQWVIRQTRRRDWPRQREAATGSLCSCTTGPEARRSLPAGPAPTCRSKVQTVPLGLPGRMGHGSEGGGLMADSDLP